MSELIIVQMTEADVEPVVALWLACGLTRPWNDPRSDIDFARKGANSVILVGRSDGRLAASIMVGHAGPGAGAISAAAAFASTWSALSQRSNASGATSTGMRSCSGCSVRVASVVTIA